MRILLIILLFSVGCGREIKKSSLVKQNVSAIYQSNQLAIKVYYQEGAEPYVDQVGPLKSWDLLEKNLEALFNGKTSKPSILIPKSLSEMTKISDEAKSSWSLKDILNLADKHSVSSPIGTTTFQFFFLSGVFKEDSAILGLHISGTKIMAIFKSVVAANSFNQTDLVAKYVEQATLVHEMGHALGLVNNGIPMVSKHQDKTNGSHCSNPECVMYYTNEGASNMQRFITKAATDLSVVMFDQQCLEDAQKY